VVTSKVASAEQVALSILKDLWDTARILNVVVLVQQDTFLNLYTWFPYTSHDQCDNVESITLVNQWVMAGEGRFVREVKLFPYKFPNNFHGCTLKISTGFKYISEDILLRKLFKALNVTLEYVTEFPHNMPFYGKMGTSLKDLVSGKSDVSYGAIPLIDRTVKYGDPSFPYYVLKFRWFVPCSKPFSRLQRISHIFSPSVWAAIVIVLFLVAVTFWLLARQGNDSRSYTTFSSALYNVWAVTVGVSVTQMPRGSMLKLMLLVLVWYSFAMSTVFQTFFTSFLVDPGYQQQPTAFEEIFESGMKFGYLHEYDKFYKDSSDWRHKELLAKREECSTKQICLNKIRETGDFATLVDEWYVQNFTNSIDDHSFVCPLNDDDYHFVYLSIYVQKGSFLLEFINKLVRVATESGLLEKAMTDYVTTNRDVPDPADIFGEYFVFTLTHLRIAFYILLVGHSLSFVVFVCEHIYRSRLGRVGVL
jgi:hypothetical protein